MQRRLPVLLAMAVAASLFAQGTLEFEAPKGWVAQPSSSAMRVASFALPRAQGDAEDAELVLYYFGGDGGSVQANVDRWIGQMMQPDGRPSREVATTSAFEANGLAVTVLDVTGTYVAEVRPGASDRNHKPGYRLKAAVIQTPSGPYFLKLTGPARTVDRWNDSVIAFLKSVRSGSRR